MLLTYCACVSAIAYVVRVLLFDGSTQPFEDPTKIVYDSDDDGFGDGADTYLVGLFDHVRRLFGAYQVEDTENAMQIWRTTVRMDLWRCPKCLSFWLTFLVSAPFFIYAKLPLQVHTYVLVHLAMVYHVQFLVFIQLWFEGDE